MKIYRGDTAIADVLITDQSYRSFSIMGDDYAVLDFYLKTEIDFEKNDYCNAFGERFSLIEKPVPEMIKGILHYNIKMYNTYKELEKVKVFLYDTARDLSKSEFPFTCTPSDIVQLIVDNMNSVQGGIWSVGNVLEGETKTITISNQSCLDLLISAASEWDTEWYVEGHTVNLAKRTYADNPIKTLSIGTGLLTVQQESLGNTSITRLYALGGTKNLPQTYGSTRLKMDVPYLEVPGADIVEDIVVFDDIYPRRLGIVSSVRNTSQGIFYFTDSQLDFNPNDCQIEGLAKHIIFQSGALVGYDFEVNYNAVTAEFEIIQYTESSGEILPSQSLYPSVGDTYIIYNIDMPQSYVTAAETELKAKAQAYFDKIKRDKLSFNIALDEVYFIANRLTLLPGEEVILKHEYIEALKNGLNIRITGFNRYLNQPYRYDSVKVSDTVYSNPISRIDRKIEEVENVIERTGISNPNYPRRNWRDLSETMNMLQKAFLNFSKGINPITVQTMQLLVGDESLQFRFVNSKTNPVPVDHSFIFDRQTGKFTTQAGILQHMTLGITDIKNSHAADEYKYWDIAAYTSPILEADKAYYLYAKCSVSQTTGAFVLSETAIGMEEISGYYHFLVGILNSQYEDDRSFVILYGFTEILPGRITTDKIVSTDGKTYFDLLSGIIGGRIKFISTSETEEDLGQWADGISHTASDALAKANTSKAITDKFGTTVDGGLIQSVMMLLRELNSTDETAGISGIRGSNRDLPAFWTGTYADAIAGTAGIIFRHNSTGKVGVLDVDANGNVIIRDVSDPTLIRLMFSKSNVPTVADILSTTQAGGTVTNPEAIYITSGSTTLTNYITVDKDSSKLTFSGTITIDAELDTPHGYTSGYALVEIILIKDDSAYATLSSIGGVLDEQHPSTSGSLTVNKELIVGVGVYKIQVKRTFINTYIASGGISGISTLAWSFIKDIRRFEFGLDGFMAWYTNNHMHFSENGGLDVRGATNIPGLLLAGEVGYTGGFTSSWGAKKHASSTAVKIATGQYRVYHSIGHMDYQVQITPTSSNRTSYISAKGTDNFVVYFYSVGSSPALSDTGFHFMITGRNY